jgi:hypothetical protein
MTLSQTHKVIFLEKKEKLGKKFQSINDLKQELQKY